MRTFPPSCAAQSELYIDFLLLHTAYRCVPSVICFGLPGIIILQPLVVVSPQCLKVSI